MNCKQIKEVLLTDYIDDQLSSKESQLVNKHLSECNDCNEYFSMVKKTTIDPIESWERGKPSEEVWLKIKDTIQLEEQFDSKIENLNIIEQLKTIYQLLKPKYAAFSMAIVFVAVIFLFSNQPQTLKQVVEISPEKQAKQIEHIVYLVEDSDDFVEGDSEDYGEAIEEYFLLSKR